MNNEQDKEFISLTKHDLEFLIRHILPTLPHVRLDDDLLPHSIIYGGDCLTFSSDEIFQPLAILATNPKTARELVKLGVISACESALNRAYKTRVPSDEDSSSEAASIKWSLHLLVELHRNGYAKPLIDFHDIISKFTDDEEDAIAQDARKLIHDTNKSQRRIRFI